MRWETQAEVDLGAMMQLATGALSAFPMGTVLPPSSLH